MAETCNHGLDWLLESDMPAVRYRCLLDLLGRPEDAADVQRARRQLLNDPQVQIVKGWADDGLLSGNRRHYALLFLAEIGVAELAEPVRPIIEEWISHPAKDGALRINRRKMLPCENAFMLYEFNVLGYGNHENVARALDWIVEGVRPDGGWLCYRRHDPSITSCPKATLDVLRLFTLYPELKDSALSERALSFLLRHWETRARIPQLPGREVPMESYFFNLRFPLLHDYHLLSYAHTLSQYPQALASKAMREVAARLEEMRDREGRFPVGSANRNYRSFEFGVKGQPSKWITLTALKTLRRTS